MNATDDGVKPAASFGMPAQPPRGSVASEECRGFDASARCSQNAAGTASRRAGPACAPGAGCRV